MRICICATQVPFSHGGAEIHVETLHQELQARGFSSEIVTVPFSWTPRLQLLRSAFAWRLLDLKTIAQEPIDLVIATRFPSYLIRHPNKVVWLIHQFRQAYDLLGTPYGEFGEGPADQAVVRMIRQMDNRALGEARALYSNARNTARRLKRFNGLQAIPLYPPPKLGSRYRRGTCGDYVFTAGRLDRTKRLDLLLRLMQRVKSPVRCRIAGTGPEKGALEELIDQLQLGERVELLGWVSDEELVELYAGSLAVFYAPYDEDYGYVTVEAFKSGKAVITASDSGGVLEFVENGRNGFVCQPQDLDEFARRIDALYHDRELAESLGADGMGRVTEIEWDRVIETLTGHLK